MPIDIQYTEDNGVIVRAVGQITIQDLVNANKSIYVNEEKIKSIKYQLCDLSQAEGIITAHDVEVLAEQDKQAAKINPKMVIAIVGSKNVAYGLARMWQTLVDESTFEKGVFRSVEEAKDWINTRIRK